MNVDLYAPCKYQPKTSYEIVSSLWKLSSYYSLVSSWSPILRCNLWSILYHQELDLRYKSLTFIRKGVKTKKKKKKKAVIKICEWGEMPQKTSKGDFRSGKE